ncbi:MAG: hypothetical protein EOM50_05520 [Erysipelotrichia bacterium]|nr:hypothetical protein [Erysipelotrichia bacterium]NCC55044.1 hypothetical protein [Erysipelotrichia bacterium]
MKKLTKLVLTIALCLSGLFAFSLNSVKAEEKDTLLVEYNEEKSFYDEKTQKFTLYYIIPEDAGNYKNVTFNFEEGMIEKIKSVSQYISPGDWYGFNIIIENNSKVNFTYKNDSLTVKDVKMKGGEYTNPWGLKSFSGSSIDKEYVPYRTGNAEAIYSELFDKFTAYKVTGKMMLSIEEELAQRDYTGDRALTQYLLNYYNNSKYYNKDGKVATTIPELDEIALNNIFSGGGGVHNNGTYALLDADYAALSDEQKAKLEYVNKNQYRFRETEAELAEYYYEYFYDWCVGLQFGKYATYEDANGKDRTVHTSSIVKLYKNQNNVRTNADDYIASQLTNDNLKAGKESSFIAGFTLDGPLTGNNAQWYKYGFTASITLEKEVKGSLSITKTIDYGTYATSDNPIFLFKATNTETNDIYYRMIALSDIQKSGTATLTDIPLGTYTVEEFNPIRYSKESVKEVTLTRDNPNASVTFNNQKTKDNDFSDSDAVINSFTKDENGKVTITQTKVKIVSDGQ